jgi:hypothetical protein
MISAGLRAPLRAAGSEYAAVSRGLFRRQIVSRDQVQEPVFEPCHRAEVRLAQSAPAAREGPLPAVCASLTNRGPTAANAPIKLPATIAQTRPEAVENSGVAESIATIRPSGTLGIRGGRK